MAIMVNTGRENSEPFYTDRNFAACWIVYKSVRNSTAPYPGWHSYSILYNYSDRHKAPLAVG